MSHSILHVSLYSAESQPILPFVTDTADPLHGVRGIHTASWNIPSKHSKPFAIVKPVSHVIAHTPPLGILYVLFRAEQFISPSVPVIVRPVNFMMPVVTGGAKHGEG
jgi:hypothetical protein